MSELPDPPPGGPAAPAGGAPSAPRGGGLLGPWFAPVKIPRDAPETLRGLAARGSLVFVMRSSGLLHFLYLRWFLRRAGLPPLRAAQGFRGFLGWVARVRRSRRAFEVHVPTRDFDVPNTKALINGLWEAIDCMSDGECLYVGCAGGLGRTGIFLAALAKAWGEPDPIRYVRTNYNPRAVETAEQEHFVNTLHIPAKMRLRVWGARMGSLLRKYATEVPASVVAAEASNPQNSAMDAVARFRSYRS